MDVKTLYNFIAVVDHGSFAGAAEALGISISGISVQMRNLEQNIGILLFDRSRRPPVLTAEGYAFALRARDVILAWEQLSESLKRSANRGVLKIGAVHTAVAGLLPAALLRLRQTVPELSIRLTTGLTHDLEAAVRGGRVDVAIVTEPDTLPADARFQMFCEERLVVIAHESASGSTFRELLEQNPYVRFSRNARVANLVEAKLDQCEIEVDSHMEVDSLEGVISLVATGLGVSVVPERLGSTSFPPTVSVHQLGTTPAARRLGLLSLVGNGRQRFSDQLFEALSEVASSSAATPGPAR